MGEERQIILFGPRCGRGRGRPCRAALSGAGASPPVPSWSGVTGWTWQAGRSPRCRIGWSPSPRDAGRLAAGDVDRCPDGVGGPGGAAEPGVAGVRFGAGHEASAISRLVRPRDGCGMAGPGLFQRQVAPAPRVPGQLRLDPPATLARTCARSPGAGRTRSPSGPQLAGTFWSVGINLWRWPGSRTSRGIEPAGGGCGGRRGGGVRAVRRGAPAGAAADGVAADRRLGAGRGPGADGAGAVVAAVGADPAAR